MKFMKNDNPLLFFIKNPSSYGDFCDFNNLRILVIMVDLQLGFKQTKNCWITLKSYIYIHLFRFIPCLFWNVLNHVFSNSHLNCSKFQMFYSVLAAVLFVMNHRELWFNHKIFEMYHKNIWNNSWHRTYGILYILRVDPSAVSALGLD